jgi:hypothetical protein
LLSTHHAFWILASVLLVTGCTNLGTVSSADNRYDDAVFCSKWLLDHQGQSQSAEGHRRCIIAVASTYVNAEDNSAPLNEQLLADDVSRHRLGTPASFLAGNGAKQQNAHSVVGAIKNRHWSVDGEEAWVVYDGYLKADPTKPSFYVAERFTIEKGLIKEILLAGVTRLDEIGKKPQ